MGAGVRLIVPGGLVIAGGKALSRALVDAAWPPTTVAIALSRVGLVLAIAVTALVALDLARIRVVRDDSRRAVRLYWSSVGLVLRHPLATLGLWAGNALLFAFVVALYVAFRNLVPARTWLGILLMLAAQQAVMLARAGLRIALFAGEAALLDRLVPTASQTAPPAPHAAATALDVAEPDSTASPSWSGLRSWNNAPGGRPCAMSSGSRPSFSQSRQPTPRSSRSCATSRSTRS